MLAIEKDDSKDSLLSRDETEPGNRNLNGGADIKNPPNKTLGRLNAGRNTYCRKGPFGLKNFQQKF